MSDILDYEGSIRIVTSSGDCCLVLGLIDCRFCLVHYLGGHSLCRCLCRGSTLCLDFRRWLVALSLPVPFKMAPQRAVRRHAGGARCFMQLEGPCHLLVIPQVIHAGKDMTSQHRCWEVGTFCFATDLRLLKSHTPEPNPKEDFRSELLRTLHA